MDVIVHFIWRDSFDKFPVGYIEFMKLRMTEYEHYFFVQDEDSTGKIRTRLKLCDERNVYYYEKGKQLKTLQKHMELLRSCDKIIISGYQLLRGSTKVFLILSRLISKTYIQFWEGNFGNYKGFLGCIKYFLGFVRHPRARISLLIRRVLVKRCAGTINLIEGDLKNLLQEFPNSTKCFIAPMPGSPVRLLDFASIRVVTMDKDNFPYKIVIGHSACKSDLHFEAFHTLRHLKDENIEIICPLSYGNANYREKVIDEGRKIFGEKFKPITNFMEKETYVKFLASCDLGVFMTIEQQGMGNISLLLRLGKKVYIREGTSIWQQYKENMKYCVYPVSELEGISLEDFVRFPSEQAYNNIKIADEYASGNQAVEQWRKVFED